MQSRLLQVVCESKLSEVKSTAESSSRNEVAVEAVITSTNNPARIVIRQLAKLASVGFEVNDALHVAAKHAL